MGRRGDGFDVGSHVKVDVNLETVANFFGIFSLFVGWNLEFWSGFAVRSIRQRRNDKFEFSFVEFEVNNVSDSHEDFFAWG